MDSYLALSQGVTQRRGGSEGFSPSQWHGLPFQTRRAPVVLLSNGVLNESPVRPLLDVEEGTGQA